ncbi:ATP-binding cassette domain-containing protein, partial [Kribbella sp. NPDC003557]|uniref:ATP-binding cassette domain-containing protein n=1 Tax=Kribbella sp. NPDC003557 TaxID=3154449 RepID=UPI0033AABF02
MTLYADLRVSRGSFELALDLTVEPGEVVALLGPNGAGKTTALRAIAGLLAVDSGRIALDAAVWDEPPSTFRTPDRRPIGVVFQDYLLFNHLSCLENVAFGLRARGVEMNRPGFGAPSVMCGRPVGRLGFVHSSRPRLRR